MAEYREGQTATLPDGSKAVFQGGVWINAGRTPAGATPRPEYGGGAYDVNGTVLVPGRQGPRVIKDNGQTADANMKGRLALGLGPMVSGEQRMEAREKQGNPFSLRTSPQNALAKTLSNVEVPMMGHPLEGVANFIGGNDFQNYDQAAASFEAALMPIMSGSAVTPTEARRTIRAALPAVGDSPEKLAAKAATRRQMLNGAASAMGKALPYPQEPTYGVNTQGPQGAAAGGHNDPLGIRRR